MDSVPRVSYRLQIPADTPVVNSTLFLVAARSSLAEPIRIDETDAGLQPGYHRQSRQFSTTLAMRSKNVCLLCNIFQILVNILATFGSFSALSASILQNKI